MKIDVFPHIFPKPFFDRMCEVVPASRYMQKRTRAIPVLTDLDLRFRIMDRYEGYVQVLTLCSPPIESLGEPAWRRISPASPTTAWPRSSSGTRTASRASWRPCR